MLAVAAAGVAALAPVEPDWVEQHYSRAIYPAIQHTLTRISNAVPFALLDLLLLTAGVVVSFAVISVFRAPRGARLRALLRRAWQGVVAAALVFLAFQATWGLNYRRERVDGWLDFDERRVTADAVIALNESAVAELARLRPGLPERAPDWPSAGATARSLEPALIEGTRLLGLPSPASPGRPKQTLLDPFFTRAGVTGMTDPFFLETLLASNLLPFEYPAVIAHEWGHLAGLARESDASLFGLVVCARGGADAQYSAWLEIFLHTLSARDAESRREVRGRLPATVRADLAAMAARTERDEVRTVSRTAWRTYDRYLRSQRVDSGVRNYGEIVRLLVGTRFGAGWTPVLRPRH